MFEFNPPFYVRNRHLQSILSPLTRKFRHVPSSEEVKLTPSLFGKFWQGSADRLVVVYHGLAGNEDAPYVLGVSLALYKAGFSVLRMRLRGAEQAPPTIPEMYHAGLTLDLPPAVDWGKKQGFESISLVGFSLSGNTILKWLGEGEKPIKAAFVVSPPVRLTSCAALVDSRKNRIYQKYFLKKLKASIDLKAQAHPEFHRFQNPDYFRSIRAFDDNVTSVYHGFSGADDYYKKAESHATLGKIRNRVAIVHAFDDPFVDSSDLLKFSKNLPRNVEVHLFRRGGHAGFYEGLYRGYRSDDWAVQFLNARG